MRHLLIAAVPLLVALVTGIAAWFLAVRRTEGRLASRLRAAEMKLSTALANNERQEDVIRDHARHIVNDLSKEMSVSLRTELKKSTPSIDSKELISAIDDKLSERLSALARPLSGIVTAVESSSAKTKSENRDSLESIRTALKEITESLTSPNQDVEIAERLDKLQSDLEQVTARVGLDLRKRIDNLTADNLRTSEALEEFRWESLNADSTLPWESPTKTAEA